MRPKRAHVLPAIRRLRYPRRFIFFDSESSVKHFGEFLPTIEEKPHAPCLIETEAWEGNHEYRYSEVERPEFRAPTTKPSPSESADICDRFWKWVSDFADTRQGGHRSSVVVVGHNVGYDMLATGGAPRLHALGWASEAPYEKGPVYIWRFTKNGRTIV